MTDLHSTIDTYLEAYGEPDGDRRSELVSRVWADDGQLIDPPLDGSGHAGISEMAATVQSRYPGHSFRRTSGIGAPLLRPLRVGARCARRDQRAHRPGRGRDR